ncbi:hypothetical protein [Vibrio alginolyticus]|uniref:hypothetical protein n=1 Tax=Vibrio alginolyticus TaxID=663 RepID=UPI002FF23CA9
MKRIFLITMIIPLLFSSFAFSSSKEASGKVKLSASSGYIIVQLLGGSENSCSNRYYFKPDTDYNRALLSMLLSSQMSGKSVWVNGSGECQSGYPFNKAYKLENMIIYVN